MVAPVLTAHLPGATGTPFGGGTFGSGTFGGGGSNAVVTGPPWVEVLLTGLPAAAYTVTFYRGSGGRTWRVRGGIGVYAVGGVTVADYEAPFGTPASYRAEMFDFDGVSLGYTDSASITMTVNQTWIHNPLDPGHAIPVHLSADTASTVQSPIQASIVTPPGSLGVFIGAGGRVGRTVPLGFITDTLQDAFTVRDMFGDEGRLGQPPILCVRPSAAINILLPRPFYCAVLNPTQTPINLVAGGERVRWSMTVQEVQPPLAGIGQTIYTLGDLDAYWPTLADIDANYLTLLDIDRDYARIGGTDNGSGGSGSGAGGGGTGTSYGSGLYGDGTYGG